MKKFAYYALVIFLVIVVLPCIIVKGCGFGTDDVNNEARESNNDNSNNNSSNNSSNNSNNNNYDDDSNDAGETDNDLKIRVYVNKEKKIVEMELEEYVKGVVAAEMPAEFEPEALKAQAVAARTYVLGRYEKIYNDEQMLHEGADICTDPAHCQAWVSKSDAMKKWSFFSSKKYWNKISDAVESTKGRIITYNDKIANPVFHSNSGGRTENAEDVWDGCVVPYLKSVVSKGEDASKEYKTTVSFKTSDFKNRLKKEYPDIKFTSSNLIKSIKILNYTEGGRVKTLQIENIKLKGTDFRRIFSLRSANFKIEGKKDSLNITTIGNGHGVGMSQWGANYLAKSGKDYEYIIKYYYLGVELSSIDTLK